MESEERDEAQPQGDDEAVSNKAVTSNQKRKAKRTASDVKKWLIKRPSFSRKKKEKETKEVDTDLGEIKKVTKLNMLTIRMNTNVIDDD